MAKDNEQNDDYVPPHFLPKPKTRRTNWGFLRRADRAGMGTPFEVGSPPDYAESESPPAPRRFITNYRTLIDQLGEIKRSKEIGRTLGNFILENPERDAPLLHQSVRLLQNKYMNPAIDSPSQEAAISFLVHRLAKYAPRYT